MIKIYANIPGIGRKEIKTKIESTDIGEKSDEWFDWTGKITGMNIQLADGSFIQFRGDTYKNTVWEIVDE